MPYNPHEELYSDKLSIELTDEQLQETIDQGLQTVQQIQEAGKNLPQIIEPTSATAEEPQQPPEEAPPEPETTQVTNKAEQWRELTAIRSLPLSERAEAKKAWDLKYYGVVNPNFGQMVKQSFLRQSPTSSFTSIPAMMGIGIVDTVIDTFNLVSPIDAPRVPKFKSNAGEAVRQLSALILPQRMLKGVLASKAVGIHKSGVAGQRLQNLGNDRLFQWVADAGLEIGTGAAVDYVSKQHQEDHNLAGMLKKWFPQTYQFIPNSIATQDTDSSDLKRSKNVKEGGVLGFFGSVLEGATKLARAGSSLSRATKWVPKDNLAKKNLKKLTEDEFTNVKFDDDPVADQVLRAEARREKELDNLAEYWTAKDPDLTEPKLGVHDVYDLDATSVRAKDVDGIVGASVDAVRVSKNIDSTYGRLGSVLTESARKYGLEAESLSKRTLLKGLAEEIKLGGKYSKELASGKVITEAEIEEAGIRLAEIITDPRMEAGEIRQLLNEFKGEIDGIKAVDSKGYRGVMKALKHYADEFLNMDVEKARAYLLTSEAGQVSDIAEGGRLMDGTAAVERAQEQILDRLQYLMVEKGLASYQAGSRLSHLNTWKSAKASGNATKMKEAAEALTEDTNSKLLEIIPKAEQYADSLRSISKERPEFLRPFMLANEMTDGNIDTMYKLNNFVRNSLGTIEKAFYDGQPEIPSIINRTQWSIIFNSVLSAFSTPVRALAGNLGGIIGKPASLAVGAMTPGMSDMHRRSFHQYAGITDTLTKAFEHMKVVYRKAATDPTSVGYIMRDDVAIKEANNLEVLKSFAKASEETGEYGPSALISLYESQDALAKHPWLRFGANSMTALDGFNRATFAVAEAKGRAFDAIMESGQELNSDTLRQASDQIYNKFFDANGMITDEAVDFATRETALNLDSSLVKGLNNVIRRFPIVRSIFMFPTTQMNSINIFRKWSPLDAVHIGNKFEGDFGAFNKYSWEEYLVNEPERLRELLASKGIAWSKNAEVEFKTKQAEYRGRVAIGTTSMMGAALMATNGRIRGNGHWDKETQRSRRGLGWKDKTYQGTDGKWYSYEFLGPIGDLIALSVDLVDNFNSISTTTFEKFQYKLAFILGASLTNKSFMQELEPLNDMLVGNPAAWNRWGATFANSLLPFAGQRGELGRLLAPMKREVNQEFLDLIRNRNNWLDPLDASGKLPYKYDFVDGTMVGYPENWWVRANNAYSPIKQYDGLSAEKQFLVDIEYDSRPFFNKSSGGAEFTTTQRSELYSLVGEQGHFRAILKDVIRDSNRLTYTDANGVKHTGFVNILKAVRRGNIPESVLKTKDFANIFRRLDVGLSQAVRLAEGTYKQNEVNSGLLEREIQLKESKQKAREGDVKGTVKVLQQHGY